MSSPLSRRLVTLLLVGWAPPGWAQSPELLEAIRLQRPVALSRAEGELTACAIRACPDSGRLALVVGHLRLSRGEARSALAPLSTRAPGPLEPYRAFYLGQARFYSGDKEGAAQAFAAALATAPDALRERVIPRLGETLLGLGRPKEALPHLEEATIGLRLPSLHFHRALARRASGDPRGAEEDLRHLAVHHPQHLYGVRALALLGEGEAALTPPERMLRARTLAAGAPREALVELLELERQAPARSASERAKRALLEAQAHFGLGDPAAAERALALASEGGADEAAAALELMARRALKADENEEARRLMAELARRFPKTRFAGEAAFFVGWLDLQAGRFADAALAFTQLQRRHPTSRMREEGLWFHALALLRLERGAEARALLTRLLRTRPRSQLVPQARYWISRSRQQDGEVAAASRGYRQIIGAYPASFYAILAALRLEELGLEAPTPFPSPIEQLDGVPPAGLAHAALLASAGLFADARLEVDRQTAAARTPDEALRFGHALQRMGEYGPAHALAARRLWGQAFAEGDGRALALFYPRAFRSAVEGAAEHHRLDPFLLWAIMRRESRFHPDAASQADARGLMQLLPQTAAAIAEALALSRPHPDALFSPGLNVQLAAWYLDRLLERFAHPVLAAAAYNAGPGVVAGWAEERHALPLDLFIESIPYRETRGYVKQVLADLHAYHRLYGSAPPTLALEVPRPRDGVGF